jgi:predicted nucleotidyltransferase
VNELALFSSVLRRDFGPGSDVDVLVSFAPDAHWSLFDLVTTQDELEAIPFLQAMTGDRDGM